MKSFEKSSEVPSNYSNDSEVAVGSFAEKESSPGHALRAWIERAKVMSRYTIESVAQKATKEAVGLAAAAVLASMSQQEVLAAQHEEKSAHSTWEQQLKTEDSEKSRTVDDALERMNAEFAAEAEKDVKKRRSGDFSGHIKGLHYKDHLRDSRGKVKTNIKVNHEGVMLSFNGGLDKIGDIPESFKNEVERIKDNPGTFIARQLLSFSAENSDEAGTTRLERDLNAMKYEGNNFTQD